VWPDSPRSTRRPERSPEARRLFRKSLELEPRNPEALAGLGSTFVLSPHEDPAPGIAALEKARGIQPDIYNLRHQIRGQLRNR
jgi:Flp pilus assembly protein TadD